MPGPAAPLDLDSFSAQPFLAHFAGACTIRSNKTAIGLLTDGVHAL